MTQTDTNKQEENPLPRFGDTPSSMHALALTTPPIALSLVGLAADVKSITFAALGWAASHLIGVGVMSYKRISAREAFATIAVCGLAGAFTGAAVGHFLSMDQESANIASGLKNEKLFATAPVQDSVAIRYPAERFCENTDIAPVPFPNGEIRKILKGADGRSVAVVCQPPRVTLAR